MLDKEILQHSSDSHSKRNERGRTRNRVSGCKNTLGGLHANKCSVTTENNMLSGREKHFANNAFKSAYYANDMRVRVGSHEPSGINCGPCGEIHV